MALFPDAGRRLAETIQGIDYTNPFLPERRDLEKRALGAAAPPLEEFLNYRPGEVEALDPHLVDLLEQARAVLEQVRGSLAEQGAGAASTAELVLYEDLALFVLYHDCHLAFRARIHVRLAGGRPDPLDFYPRFEKEVRRLLRPGAARLPHDDPPEHLFAFFFQLNRAFVNIYHEIVGGSRAAAALRGAIWQSIFTHDLRRYRRALFERMGDIPTLIVGPSGTGKELVARAIALSRYVPFDARKQAFVEDFASAFLPLNLSALSPTLIESELFGHRRGAFTGALEDRVGYFEACSPRGSVFLDEIGDLDVALQVKLLRVLQARVFQRLGDAEPRPFAGKVIAATNRDLARGMREGRFRDDLYYRLCADLVETPPLAAMIAGRREELARLVQFVCERAVGPEAGPLAGEVLEFIDSRLGLDYPWPGNFRELEQCARNVLVRREYRPAPRAATDGRRAFLEAVGGGALSADQLLNEYCALVHERTGSYAAAARALGLDRRTVRARVAAAHGGGDGDAQERTSRDDETV